MDTSSSDTIGESPTVREDGAVDFSRLVAAYLQDYHLRQFRVVDARGRVKHLQAFFDATTLAGDITTSDIRQYQVVRRQQAAAGAAVNRETSALCRMFHIALQLGWVASSPTFPPRLRESPPRQGFFEHHEYLAVRRRLPSAFRDVLDFAYYFGWRRREILELTCSEVDWKGV